MALRDINKTSADNGEMCFDNTHLWMLVQKVRSTRDFLRSINALAELSYLNIFGIHLLIQRKALDIPLISSMESTQFNPLVCWIPGKNQYSQIKTCKTPGHTVYSLKLSKTFFFFFLHKK